MISKNIDLKHGSGDGACWICNRDEVLLVETTNFRGEAFKLPTCGYHIPKESRIISFKKSIDRRSQLIPGDANPATSS